MSKGLTIIDKDYTQWVENLSVRYRQSQTPAGSGSSSRCTSA